MIMVQYIILFPLEDLMALYVDGPSTGKKIIYYKYNANEMISIHIHKDQHTLLRQYAIESISRIQH